MPATLTGGFHTEPEHAAPGGQAVVPPDAWVNWSGGLPVTLVVWKRVHPMSLAAPPIPGSPTRMVNSAGWNMTTFPATTEMAWFVVVTTPASAESKLLP